MRLVVIPPLNGVSGERIVLSTGNDLALIHIAAPSFSGTKYVVKRGFDMLASSVGILALTPVWIAIAVVVRLGDGGAVIFRQNRVGLDGREFPMFKFRTMVPDAEAVLATLEAARERDAGNSVMFKMRDDPRITRPGRFLRRFSLDELPQLFNVWLGHMSLVGPRPPLPREVTAYEEMVNRKFLIRPGITGLWQTSGRSNLSWEESVRLDLYYVENWTMRRDLSILLRTARAVVAREGAF
jgi:Sugar transferases involved in lipopolysaccharide synthesis